MVENIFFDFHGTLSDFEASETEALILSGKEYNISLTAEEIKLYKSINASLWERFNVGEITREQVFFKRFEKFLNALSVSVNPKDFNDIFLGKLDSTMILEKHVKEVLECLSNSYKLFVITNGIQKAVIKKMDTACISSFITDVYTSERCRYHKPSVDFFSYCLAASNAKSNECLVVGDSLTADIKGGLDSGILTCWFNPYKMKNNTDIKPDFEIRDFSELLFLLLNQN